MSTITKEFTKEQLKKAAQDEIAAWSSAIVKEPDNEKYHLWLRLAEITLASLEAEPVGEFYHEARWGWYEISEGDSVPERSRIPLYRVPPAPVSEPEWTNEQCLEFLSIAFRHAEIKGDLELDDIRLGVKMVNGSRAAMLQGAAGNSPVIPDGWVACSERMPENKPGSYEYLVFEELNNGVHHDYWNVPDAGDDCQFTPFWNHYDRYVTHWQPLPSPPAK